MVAAPGQQGAEAEDRPNPARALGGLMGRLKKKKDEEPAAAGGGAKNPNRKTVFTSTTEIVKASGTAAPADVAIPAGFKPKG